MKRVKHILRNRKRRSGSAPNTCVVGQDPGVSNSAVSGASISPTDTNPSQARQQQQLLSGNHGNHGPNAPFPDGIKVWIDCADATIDICFVHGLTGDRDKTWTARAQSTPWPKTLLPAKLPKARLLTYGYDAYIVRTSVASTTRLIDYASNLLHDLTTSRVSCNAFSRPLIFVAHSLGGLVCKEALLRSRNAPEPHLCGIFDYTVGIAFMGTPHRGSWMADWARIPASALGCIKSTNKSLLDVLHTNDQLLESIQIRFWEMVRELREGVRAEPRRFEVSCFFEELPLPVVGSVVSKTSATLEGYTAVGIRADHRDIARCGSAEEIGFQRLLGELTRWQEQSSQTPTYISGEVLRSPAAGGNPAAERTIKPPVHLIPLVKNKRFVGRENTLLSLQRMFFTGERQKVAVVGLGGIGKTQVALEFAYWVKEEKPEYSIFWIPGLSSASFNRAMTEIAKELGVYTPRDDPRESVKRFLSSEASGKWLLVLDNADDMDIVFGSSDNTDAISHFLPSNGDGLFLFTTRFREVAVSASVEEVVELGMLEPDEAKYFLQSSLFWKDMLGDERGVTSLLQELAYLPLAIAQAIAYLNRNRVSIPEYLALLRDSEEDMVSLLSREFLDQTRYAGSNNAVVTTWLVSFNQICRSDSVARELMSFISCIEPKAIPRSILPALGSNEEMVHAIGTLDAYAFITKRKGGDTFDMHSLVHLAMRSWVNQQGLQQQATRTTVAHMAGIFPDGAWENQKRWREYMPHAVKVLQWKQYSQTYETFHLYHQVGVCLSREWRVTEGIKYCELAYEWMRHHLAEYDPKLRESQHMLAIAYMKNGNFPKAIELLEHVVEIEKRLDMADLKRVESQHELAAAYLMNKQTEVAIQLLKHIVETEAVLPETDSSRLISLQLLGGAYSMDGQSEMAIKLLEPVVKIREEALERTHPDRLSSQHELGRVYLMDGQTKKALELLQYVVNVKETALAETHPSRLLSQYHLARAYFADRQIQKAVQLLSHAVRLRNATLEETHPRRIESQKLLAEWQDSVANV
ncbi:hypothetical protein F5Y01DRAFT_47282 [Xylaria sp. FL0043]|nr:hypothetical protein F5Y01DRAFT_47282 [Xylaria sp. FL0043]